MRCWSYINFWEFEKNRTLLLEQIIIKKNQIFCCKLSIDYSFIYLFRVCDLQHRSNQWKFDFYYMHKCEKMSYFHPRIPPLYWWHEIFMIQPKSDRVNSSKNHKINICNSMLCYVSYYLVACQSYLGVRACLILQSLVDRIMQNGHIFRMRQTRAFKISWN